MTHRSARVSLVLASKELASNTQTRVSGAVAATGAGPGDGRVMWVPTKHCMASAPALAGRLRVRLPSSERGWGALYGRSIDDARNTPHALVPKPAHCSPSWLTSPWLKMPRMYPWSLVGILPRRPFGLVGSSSTSHRVASGPWGAGCPQIRSRLGHPLGRGGGSQGSLAETPHWSPKSRNPNCLAPVGHN